MLQREMVEREGCERKGREALRCDGAHQECMLCSQIPELLTPRHTSQHSSYSLTGAPGLWGCWLQGPWEGEGALPRLALLLLSRAPPSASTASSPITSVVPVVYFKIRFLADDYAAEGGNHANASPLDCSTSRPHRSSWPPSPSFSSQTVHAHKCVSKARCWLRHIARVGMQ